MPTTAMENVKIWYRADGHALETREYPEAPSQTFKRGAYLVLNGSGQVLLAKGANTTYGSSDKPLGVALSDSTGTTNGTILAGVFDGQARVVLPVSNAGASIATNQNQVGVSYGLHVNASGYVSVNTNDTTNTKIVVERIHPQYPAAEAWGWLECKFIGGQTQFGS